MIRPILILAVAFGAFTFSQIVHSTATIVVAQKTGVFDVRKYGAKGDGKALDSPAINKAIDAAAAAGGGTVLFTAGTYRSFSIRLKSNVALPAYGFFIRHVKGLQMRDVEVTYLSPDLRPAFWLNDVTDLEFIHVKAQREAISDQRIERLEGKRLFRQDFRIYRI
jgi:hypothetical protein